MPGILRIILVIGACIAFYFVTRRIRKRLVLMGDAISWVLLSLALIVLALFPNIASFFSSVLGFVSPSNFVFLTIIVYLLAKVFTNSCEISLFKHRVNELAQEQALLEKRLRDIEHRCSSRHED